MSWLQSLPPSWAAVLNGRLPLPAFQQVQRLWEEVVGQPDVFPDRNAVFAALSKVPPEHVKVVVLGQDPYHGAGQAHGLAFSVRHGMPHPPSLRNVLKELSTDLPATRLVEEPVGDGVLSGWSAQGVLLLNAVLTVEQGKAGSHQGKGWEALTSALVEAVAVVPGPRVFLLWGKHAEPFAQAIHLPEHLVIASPHPSPLSAYRGFFGSRPFSRANLWLEQLGEEPVDWWRGIPNR